MTNGLCTEHSSKVPFLEGVLMSRFSLLVPCLLLLGCMKELGKEKIDLANVADKSGLSTDKIVPKIHLSFDNKNQKLGDLFKRDAFKPISNLADHTLNVLKNSDQIGDATMSDVVGFQILDSIGASVENAPPCCTYDADLVEILDKFRMYVTEEKASEVEVYITPAEFQSKQNEIKKMRWVDEFSKPSTSDSVVAMCNRLEIVRGTLNGQGESIKWKEIEVHRKRTEEFISQYRGVPNLRLWLVVMHELYHCILDRGHLPDDVMGIMNKNISVVTGNLQNNWFELISDMLSIKFVERTPVLK